MSITYFIIYRYGHQCEYAWIAVSLIQWDGFSKELADAAYDQISQKTAAYGNHLFI